MSKTCDNCGTEKKPSSVPYAVLEDFKETLTCIFLSKSPQHYNADITVLHFMQQEARIRDSAKVRWLLSRRAGKWK